MKTTFKTISILLICFVLLSVGRVALAYQSPTANAGPDLYINSTQQIVLQGSGYDPQGAALSYYWNCSGGTLSLSAVAQPTFTAPSVTNQNYTCSLTVTNSYSLSNSDSMTVFVNSNNQINVGGVNVQTNSATNISNNQATLNGYLSMPYINGTNYVWFQYGTDTNYNNSTGQQNFNSSGSFSQNITGLYSNATYHFRAIASTPNGTIYGQDMTFNSNGSNYYYGNGSGYLSVTKQVINLTSGNLNWSSFVNAKPGDVLSFAITIQANASQQIDNVFVRDILPSDLIYKGNLTVNASLNYFGTPSSGINIGTIPAGGLEIIAYQAQVASANNFSYGNTTLSNNATVTSNQAGTQTASANVIVNNSLVYGASTGPTYVPTGLTNNPVTDSFFLPIFLIILMSWLYFTGRIYRFSDWLEAKIK